MGIKIWGSQMKTNNCGGGGGLYGIQKVARLGEGCLKS